MTRLISTLGGRSVSLDSRKLYSLDRHTCHSLHSSFALAELVSNVDGYEKPEEVLLIRTSENERVEERLREEGNRFQIDQTTFETRRDTTPGSMRLLKQIMDLTGEKPCLFDLTGSDPELTALMCGYASSRLPRGESERSPIVFVGRKKPDQKEIQFRNLNTALGLPGWGVSHELLMEYNESGPLARRIDDLHDESYKDEHLPQSNRLQQLAHMLSGSTRNLSSALPIEAGVSVQTANDTFWKEVMGDANRLMPILKQILPGVRKFFQKIGVEGAVSGKSELELTENELRRQLSCARELVRSGKLLPAFLLARELLVNGALLGSSTSRAGEQWLDSENRSRAAAPFYLLNHWNQYEDLRELPRKRQRRVSKLWGAIKDRRNKLAHAGFCKDSLRYERLQTNLEEKLQDIRSLILQEREILENPLNFPFDGHLFMFAVARNPDRNDPALPSIEELNNVTSVIVLVPEQNNSGRILEHFRETGGAKDVNIEYWEVPLNDQRFEYWQDLWEKHRRTLLQNATVTFSVSEGPPALRHTIRQLFNRTSQFGIQTELMVFERKGRSDEQSVPTTIDARWTS